MQRYSFLQEKHHYIPTLGILESVKRRDKEKKALAAAKGLSLVIVPCWWDGQVERYSRTPEPDIRSQIYQPSSYNQKRETRPSVNG